MRPIDLVVLRRKDANTAWTSASDGALEQRLYFCQKWRADVSALVSSAGAMFEWAKYCSYGIPFGLPAADTNSDGDCDASDVTQRSARVESPCPRAPGLVRPKRNRKASTRSTSSTLTQISTAFTLGLTL